jgi:hypothetical protein
LLGEHFAVQGDPAAEGHGRKMSASRTFFFGPGAHGRADFGETLFE